MKNLFSIESEQAVVGAFLLTSMNKHKAAQVCALLTSADFYHHSHQRIFEVYLTLQDKGQVIDVLTVNNVLESTQQLAKIGGLPYLAELANNTPSAANVLSYAQTVKDLAVERNLARDALICKEFIETSELPHGEKVQQAVSDFNKNILAASHEKTKDFKEALQSAIENLESRHQNADVLDGLSTGIDLLDSRTGGLKPSKLYILAARPGMGKTALMLNITSHVCLEGGVANIHSLEMDSEELAERLLVSCSNIPASRFKSAKLVENDWPKLSNTIAGLLKYNMVVNDKSAQTLLDIRRECESSLLRFGRLDLIVIDYLQLIESTTTSRFESQLQKITDISRSLKNLAKDYKCPVICLSQLNRSPEQRPDKRPVLSDLRDSGAIEQDADVIWFLYRDAYYNESSTHKGIAELITAKYRSGVTGTDFINDELHYYRFTNRHEAVPELERNDVSQGFNPKRFG